MTMIAAFARLSTASAALATVALTGVATPSFSQRVPDRVEERVEERIEDRQDARQDARQDGRHNGPHQSGWERLGSRSVRLIGDRDVIPVTLLRGDFRRIQLRVRENGVFINQLTVVYATGAHDQIPMRYLIRSGGWSRIIDLRGGDRIIRSIELSYRSVPNSRGRAVVDVFGRR